MGSHKEHLGYQKKITNDRHKFAYEFFAVDSRINELKM
jgi:hypothetical protein